MSLAQWTYNYYLGKGVPPHVAAGIVDNYQVESGFRPEVLDGRVRGDAGTAFGLAQWRGDRYNNLKAFAKERGGSHFDIQTQADFGLMEMDPNFRYHDPIASSNRNAIFGAPDRHTAAINFARYFERPAAQHIPSRPMAANLNMQGGSAGLEGLLSAQSPATPAAQGAMDVAASTKSPLGGLFGMMMMANQQQPQTPTPPPAPQMQRAPVQYQHTGPTRPEDREEVLRRRRAY